MTEQPRIGYRYTDLYVGMAFRSPGRTISEADLMAFSGLTGDFSELHTSDVYAKASQFGRRVAHGMLLGGFISAVLGDALPGPGSIYLGQTVEFLHPVRIGDQVKVKATVTAVDRARATLETLCLVGDVVVARGEATVIPPRRRKTQEAS